MSNSSIESLHKASLHSLIVALHVYQQEGTIFISPQHPRKEKHSIRLTKECEKVDQMRVKKNPRIVCKVVFLGII
jgi:hypothetical protein